VALLAYQARQEQAQATAALGELPAEDYAHLPEESGPFQQQEEPQELRISQRFCQPLSVDQRASQQISARWRHPSPRTAVRPGL
jgi:hypothetical protein